MVPFLDLKSSTDAIRPELDEVYNRFMDSGYYVLGPEVSNFESQYAELCDAKFCVGVGTGLDAIILGLRALEIGDGDEVLVPSNTYIATWLAVTAVGAVPVPVEPCERTFNVDAGRLSEAITPRTRAVLGVNLYGHPLDYDAVRSICEDYDLRFVTDNAQGHLSRYKGAVVGGLADVECHSFYPTKNLGALGEAGCITTNSEAICDRVRSLRNYGSSVRYHHDEVGTNSRIDALQAAFLSVKLKYLSCWTNRRRSIANVYTERLRECSALVLPVELETVEHCWHQYVIRHEARDEFISALDKLGIGTLIHYPIPPHRSKAYENLGYSKGRFPIAEQMASTVLSIPIHPFLDDDSVMKVCDAILEVGS